MNDEPDYDSLDPGIRDVVRLLRSHGFETNDSGDGVSKPADWYEPDDFGIAEAMPVPNVSASTTIATMIEDAERMALVLGEGWDVQASYGTVDRIPMLLATKDVALMIRRSECSTFAV